MTSTPCAPPARPPLTAPAVRELAAGLDDGQLPAYVYDLGGLRSHAAAVRAALPEPVELYYAAKANPEPRLLDALRPWVAGYEVASAGEAAHVRAAVPGARLAFGGPGKTPAELEAALRAGTYRLHVESAHELRLLAALARRLGVRADVLLRVNLAISGATLSGAPLAMGGGPTPFGVDPAEVGDCLALIRAAGGALRLRGVHAHLASGLSAPAAVAAAGEVAGYAAGLGAAEVCVGGGMAVDYADPRARFDWAGYGAGLAGLAARHPGLRLRIEPGRSLTAYCGWYVTDVLDVKRSHGEEFAVLRGGTHHLRTPAARGHAQPFEVLAVDGWPHPFPRPRAAGGRLTLVGQLCTPKDVLAAGAAAGGLRAGDRVAFAMAGAYAWTISHHDFLMHPHPGFHFTG